MAAELLRATALHAYYGESHVLQGVEYHVNRGEVVTLLGRNGAGRTTTLKAMLGLVGRRCGSVMIDGRETISLAPHQIAHLGVGYCPEERGIYASLSTEENLRVPPDLAPRGITLVGSYDAIGAGRAIRSLDGHARSELHLRTWLRLSELSGGPPGAPIAQIARSAGRGRSNSNR